MNFELTHLVELSIPLIVFCRPLVRFVPRSSLFQRCYYLLPQLQQNHGNYSTDHCTKYWTLPKFVRRKHSARLSRSRTNRKTHCPSLPWRSSRQIDRNKISQKYQPIRQESPLLKSNREGLHVTAFCSYNSYGGSAILIVMADVTNMIYDNMTNMTCLTA